MQQRDAKAGNRELIITNILRLMSATAEEVFFRADVGRSAVEL